MPAGRPAWRCAECKAKKRRCTHVEYTTTSRARADGYAATRVLCSGAVRRRPAIPHCEDRQTCTRRRAAAITFSHDTLKVRENRVAGPAHEHPPSRLTGPARQLAVCPVRAGRSRQGGKAPRACRDAHSDRLAGAESRPLACMLACLLARICPPARWHPRPPAGMPDCSYARSPVQCRAVLCDAVPYRADACACGGVRARCVVWVVSCGVVQCWCGVGASVPVPVPVPVRGSPCSYARLSPARSV